jgi:hypothetical protein
MDLGAGRVAVEHSEVTGPEAEPDGYSKYGPGPFDVIRLKWTARLLSDGWYVVDETIGASIPVTSEPMLRDRVIEYIDQCETKAFDGYEEVKHTIGRKSFRLASPDRIESVVADGIGMAAFAQNVERSSEVSSAIPPECVQSHETFPAAIAAETGELTISSPSAEPLPSVAELASLVERETAETIQTQSGPMADHEIPSETVGIDGPGTATLDGNAQNEADAPAVIAAEIAEINQDRSDGSGSSKVVPLLSGEDATEEMANTNFIAEPNLSYESLETLKQTGKEANAGGVDHVLRQIQDLLARWGQVI